MTKKLKIGLIATLSALLAVCMAMLLPLAPKVSAAEATNNTCNGFAFKAQAGINQDGFENGEYKLTFDMEVKDVKHVNLLSYNKWNPDNYVEYYSAGVLQPGTKTLAKDAFAYTFTVYRDNGDGKTVVNTDRIKVYYRYRVLDGKLYLERFVGAQKLLEDNEDVSVVFADDYVSVYGKDGATWKSRVDSVIKSSFSGYELIEAGLVDKAPFLTQIQISGVSPFTQYRVGFSYKYYIEKQYNYYFLEGYKVEAYNYSDKCQSNLSSIKSVLSELEESGMLNETFEGTKLDKANEILGNELVKRVKIKYLVQLTDAPYASHVYKYVDVPVLASKIFVQDVCLQLGVDKIDCMSSLCEDFVWSEEEQCYVAHYLKDVYIQARTQDEHSVNYFLDINKSFYETYYGFVEAGIFSADMYEYVWSEILKKYPSVRNHSPEEVYGLYGIVVMPNAMTILNMYETLFGDDGTFSTKNITSYFTFTDTISRTSYQKLLDDYDYTWLETFQDKIFINTGMTEATATYFLFMAEPGSKAEAIGKGDADDKTPIKETIDNWISSVLGMFSGSSASGASCALGGCGTGDGGSCLGGLSMGTVLLIAGVIVVVILARKKK